jgi:hypothetical protein
MSASSENEDKTLTDNERSDQNACGILIGL